MACVVDEVRIRIEPRGQEITAAAGAVLLDALRRADIPISYSCESGRCGTCRCELIAGEVIEEASEFRAAVIPRAKRQVLACRTRLVSDCVIGVPRPDEAVTHPPQLLKCRVESIRALNESTIGLSLRPNRPLRFSAGQFARLDFGAALSRSYSMANAESEELLEFHVRRVPGGRASGFIADQLQVGQFVKLIGPLGTSYLRRKHGGPALLIAGGTGLAPMASIVRTALMTAGGSLHLYVGARSENELYEWLRALAHAHAARLRLHLGVDAPARDGFVRHGRVTDLVSADMSSLVDWKVYLAGPPPMVEAAMDLTLQLGAHERDIHADAFYPSET